MSSGNENDNDLENKVAGLSLEENNKDSEKTQKHQAPSEFWPSMESSSDAVLILNIPLFSEYLVSNVEDDVYGAAVNLRKVLSIEHHPPIDAVVKSNAVPRLTSLLRHSNPKIQFEAAWALSNVASGDDEQTAAVVECGAIGEFVRLASPGNDSDVIEQAVWGLGNIAGTSPEERDAILAHEGIFYQFQALLGQSPLSRIRNISWAISNLLRGKPSPPLEKKRLALPILTTLLAMNDREVLTDACWALSYVSDGPNENIQAVIEAGCVQRLVALLNSHDRAVLTPCVRCLGNIVTGDEIQTQVAINVGLLPGIIQILRQNDVSRAILKECCWALSNISAGSQNQIQRMLEAGVFEELHRLVATADYEVIKEILWTISNATNGTLPQIDAMFIKHDLLNFFVSNLKINDQIAISVVLEGLKNTFALANAQLSSPHIFAKELGKCEFDVVARLKTLKEINRCRDLAFEVLDLVEEALGHFTTVKPARKPLANV